MFLFVMVFVRSLIVSQLHSKHNSDTYLCWSAMTMGMRVYTAVSLSTRKKKKKKSNIFSVTTCKQLWLMDDRILNVKYIRVVYAG